MFDADQFVDALKRVAEGGTAMDPVVQAVAQRLFLSESAISKYTTSINPSDRA